jgi:hypothetical protein
MEREQQPSSRPIPTLSNINIQLPSSHHHDHHRIREGSQDFRVSREGGGGKGSDYGRYNERDRHDRKRSPPPLSPPLDRNQHKTRRRR